MHYLQFYFSKTQLYSNHTKPNAMGNVHTNEINFCKKDSSSVVFYPLLRLTE